MEGEQDAVFAWREQRLAELGLVTSDSYLGALLEIDWHEVERLVRVGCDPELAIRIVA
jgi:hypothetical protein